MGRILEIGHIGFRNNPRCSLLCVFTRIYPYVRHFDINVCKMTCVRVNTNVCHKPRFCVVYILPSRTEMKGLFQIYQKILYSQKSTEM